METHGLTDGGQRSTDLGTVHPQLLAQPLQHLQVLLAPLAPAVMRHVPIDLRGKREKAVSKWNCPCEAAGQQER